MHTYSFEKLEVWKDARNLVKLIYFLSNNSLPEQERFTLANQIKRAVVSVSSNIAEGTSRFSPKEKIRFVEMSYGSLMELYAQLILCVDLQYINDEQINEIKPLIFKISNYLNALKTAYQKQLNK